EHRPRPAPLARRPLAPVLTDPSPMAAPGPVQNLSATAGNLSVAAGWDPPLTGAAPTGYVALLVYEQTGAVVASRNLSVFDPHEVEFTEADGVLNANEYVVGVYAESAEGDGALAYSNIVEPAPTPPGPVQDLSAA